MEFQIFKVSPILQHQNLSKSIQIWVPVASEANPKLTRRPMLCGFQQ